jgi:integrase
MVHREAAPVDGGKPLPGNQSRETPSVLTVDEAKALLRAAENLKDGQLVPYVAVCLFGGLRPFEAQRLTWQQVNLKDGELRLEANQTKTGMPRVIAICPTLKKWLKSCEGKEFFPANWRRDFDAIKETAGFRARSDEKNLKVWIDDVMRHTAISHYFRKTGSYGQTAEQFGNSEAIIKKHYQGRVSSSDTVKFYRLKPGGKNI